MNPKKLSNRLRCPLALLLAAGWAAMTPSVGRSQNHPAEIPEAEANELPYRETGQITVYFGNKNYIGSATSIHRYTGLTAGHLLYSPDGGFAHGAAFQPALYKTPTLTQQIGYFAVLSGYQDQADIAQNSDDSFARDMGYFLLNTPEVRGEWAAFTDDNSLLTSGKSFLVLGYAAQSFPGNILAYVNVVEPYIDDLPGLFGNESYYTQEGMSGGPVYVTEGSTMLITGVNVAGNLPGDPAFSLMRAITPDVRPLLINAEYDHKLITGGLIKGPVTVGAGSVAGYRASVIFADGKMQGKGALPSYDELEILPQGAARKKVTVSKVRAGKFHLAFDAALASGTVVKLRLLRDSLKNRGQTPLAVYTVTIQ